MQLKIRLNNQTNSYIVANRGNAILNKGRLLLRRLNSSKYILTKFNITLAITIINNITSIALLIIAYKLIIRVRLRRTVIIIRDRNIQNYISLNIFK